jgi:single-stranded-DNA-specific exonuclease
MRDTLGKLSVSGKRWNVPAAFEVSPELVAAAGGSVLLATILHRRGLSELIALESYLDSTKYVPTHPNELEAMPAAVTRIAQAVEAQEQITVYGDYDVDGITGTSLLLTVLSLMGAKVDFYIPNRADEGYGLNLKAVSVLGSQRQTKLIVTCDCGISNFAEINFAKAHGIETIIVDHHTMPELLPPALAILHPKLLSEDHALFHLPGVGVAYKLGEALLSYIDKSEHAQELLDYVTLGMIADMVPLVKENRYLVQIGLPRLAASQRPGIKALLSNIGEGNNGNKLNSSDLVGFGLAPRINAVGRLANADIAVQLLTTSDQSVSQDLAQQLELDNRRRQDLCQRILEEAERMVEAERASSVAPPSAIVIYKEDWHHGVVGIVASRLVEKYHCPVFIGELNLEQRQLKGSARGIDALDLHEVLKSNANLLNRWGGHKMAAGFSLDAEKAPAFKVAIEETCRRMLSGSTLTPVLEIDALLKPTQVSMELVKELSALAPFGIGNKKPVLLMQNLKCSSALPLGKEQKHARLFVQDQLGQAGFETVYWNHKGKVPRPGTDLDLAFCAEINDYKGQQRLQLVVVDWCSQSAPVANDTAPAVGNLPPAITISEAAPAPTMWKDLRNFADTDSILKSAVEKPDMAIFAENAKVTAPLLIDRNNQQTSQHLLLWSYPPSLEVLAQIVNSCKPQNIYLSGAATMAHDTSNVHAFLKHLTSLIRFAVNQRGGKAEASRLAAALGATDISIALGLALLKKTQVLDWFSENGLLHFDFAGTALPVIDTMPEYQQLTQLLQEIVLFRRWCTTASLNEIKQTAAQGDPSYVGAGIGFQSSQPA